MTTTAQERSLYEEVILEHNRHPRHFPENPPGSNHHGHGFNPLCNDEVDLHLQVQDGMIRSIGFEGAGCAVSMASASLLTEAVEGKPVTEVRALFQRVHAMLAEDGPSDGVGKLKVLAGVKEFPMRVKCATLAWHTLMAALEQREDTVSTEEGVARCPQPE
jgi:nitrogen fixation protein NifU and related proteins